MPVTFDAAPLQLFSDPGLQNDNAIIQLGQDKALKSDSTFSSMNIFRWMRSSETQQKNNAIRTQLLQSLGESFGLKGMGTGKNGEVTFSREFMDKLEKLIGPAFKREDFGVSAQGGAVTSGKPLTARRLNAIYASASVYDVSNFDLAAYKQKIGVILKEQFGIDTTLNLSKEKFAEMKEKSKAFEVFAGIEKSIDFLQNDFKGFFREHEDFTALKFYTDDPKELADHPNKYELRDPNTGKYIKMGGRFEGSPNNALFTALRGNLIHTERADFSVEKSIDLAPLNKYVEGVLKGFIKNGIDAYMEAKMNDKTEALMAPLEKDPGACTEEKSQRFYKFRQDNFQEKVDAKLEDELETIIRRSQNNPLNKVIEDELNDIMKNNPKFETWEEFRPVLQQRLVKLKRPMVTATENNGKIEFKPVLDKDGDPVMRTIKPEDIDDIGKKVYVSIFGEDD